MTSLVNNSNLNSALINTINASESKYNPNVYNTKRINPAAAVTYVRTDKSSGTVAANQTITFDLMKYGICQQINLVYDKVCTNAFTVKNYDFLNVIDRIELLSSSKVIDTLTRHDLLAQFSNLETSQYNIVNSSCIAARGTSATSHRYVIPLCFGLFGDVNTNLNLQFNEPMSIRIRWGQSFIFGSQDNISLSDTAQLIVRYKAYNEADFSEILAQNYNEPELNQLSKGFYDENIVTQSLTGTVDSTTLVKMPLTDKGARVELKNTDCVNDFYVMVLQKGVPSARANDPFEPRQINRVRMTASGQELFDLQGEELFYSKLCMNGFSIMTAPVGDNITKVVKIQTGLWEYSGGGTQSNTVSLRELNNPIIEVWFEDTITSPAGGAVTQDYDVIVCEDAVKIYSTTSATGRLQTALTN